MHPCLLFSIFSVASVSGQQQRSNAYHDTVIICQLPNGSRFRAGLKFFRGGVFCHRGAQDFERSMVFCFVTSCPAQHLGHRYNPGLIRFCLVPTTQIINPSKP